MGILVGLYFVVGGVYSVLALKNALKQKPITSKGYAIALMLATLIVAIAWPVVAYEGKLEK